MPPTIDVFGVAVLVLGLTALGLSVIFEASRLSATAGKQALVRRRLQARERERIEVRMRLESMEAEAAAKQTVLDGLMAERSRIIAATTSLKLSKVEMVHEVGEPEPGLALFHADLRSDTAAGRGEPRRIVFARPIWERSNVAHVWAETPESAMAAVQRAFNARSGIVATRIQRAAAPQRPERPAEPTAEAPAAGERSPERPVLRMASTPRAA